MLDCLDGSRVSPSTPGSCSGSCSRSGLRFLWTWPVFGFGLGLLCCRSSDFPACRPIVMMAVQMLAGRGMFNLASVLRFTFIELKTLSPISPKPYQFCLCVELNVCRASNRVENVRFVTSWPGSVCLSFQVVANSQNWLTTFAAEYPTGHHCYDTCNSELAITPSRSCHMHLISIHIPIYRVVS